MLYHDPHQRISFGKNLLFPYVMRLILAICDKCIKENKEEQITMYSVANMLTTLGTKKIKDEETGVESDALDEYFSNFLLTMWQKCNMQHLTSHLV